LEVWRHAFLTFALGGCEWSAIRSGRFNPEERQAVRTLEPVFVLWGMEKVLLFGVET